MKLNEFLLMLDCVSTGLLFYIASSYVAIKFVQVVFFL